MGFTAHVPEDFVPYELSLLAALRVAERYLADLSR